MQMADLKLELPQSEAINFEWLLSKAKKMEFHGLLDTLSPEERVAFLVGVQLGWRRSLDLPRTDEETTNTNFPRVIGETQKSLER